MKEVTEWDNNPRMMWVWDDEVEEREMRKVVYIRKPEENKDLYPVMTVSAIFKHCAEIKPEPEKKARPYYGVLELTQEWEKKARKAPPSNTFPLIWIVEKQTNIVYLVTGYCHEDDTVAIGGSWVGMQALCAHYRYIDGTPCGVIE